MMRNNLFTNKSGSFSFIRLLWGLQLVIGITESVKSQQQVSQIPPGWIVWSADLVPVPKSQDFASRIGGSGIVYDTPSQSGCVDIDESNGRTVAHLNVTASCEPGMASAHGQSMAMVIGGDEFEGKLVQLNGCSIGFIGVGVRNATGEAGIGHSFSGSVDYEVVCVPSNEPYDSLIAQVVMVNLAKSDDLVAWPGGDTANSGVSVNGVGKAGFTFTQGVWGGSWTQFNPNTLLFDEQIVLNHPSGIVAIANFEVECGDIITPAFGSEFADLAISHGDPAERTIGSEMCSISIAVTVHAVKFP